MTSINRKGVTNNKNVSMNNMQDYAKPTKKVYKTPERLSKTRNIRQMPKLSNKITTNDALAVFKPAY